MVQQAGSSSVTYNWTYDVFLSFRGEDTRLGFIGHLREALRQRGIRAFIDDEGIRTGEKITPTLLQAIEESRVAIIVFSENYAKSTFCLEELAKILDCFKEESRLIYPVFYHVDPSELRRPRGSYAEALASLEERFKDKKRVEKWRLALSQAANLKGCHLKPNITNEQEGITEIISEVSARINHDLLDVTSYPVGLVPRVKEVVTLLELRSIEETKMIGIWGPGGIGKSTIARALYNGIAVHFEGLCFLSNVRKMSQKRNGLPHLQETLLRKLVMEKDLKLGDFHEGIPIIKRRLGQKKILLILDDVDELVQLEALAGSYDWFGLGSRVVITTRNKQLLVSHTHVKCIYEVRKLNKEESLQLLSWHAFKKENVESDFIEVSNHAILYSCGFPLALEVIGSDLCGKGVDQWSVALDQFKAIPHGKVLKVVQLSYDALGEFEKKVFLDLACFFNGEKLGDVKCRLLYLYEIPPENAINVLMDKSLIKIEGDCVIMHDLMEDMGKEIVRRESQDEPGERSRLWFYRDILQVLQHDTGTNKVKAIVLDLPQGNEVHWSGEAFVKMKNLKMLVIKNACFPKGPIYLPNCLRWLEWEKYPFRFLPLDFCPIELVYLNLSYSYVDLLQLPFDKVLFTKEGKLNYVFPEKEFPEDLMLNKVSGSPLSFSIGEKFSMILIWIMIINQPERPPINNTVDLDISVRIDGVSHKVLSEQWFSSFTVDHLYIFDLFSIINKAELELSKSFKWNGRNHVEIFVKNNIQDTKIHLGTNVGKQGMKLENNLQPVWGHDVFLSFQASDHDSYFFKNKLYGALCQNNIKAFNAKFRREEGILPTVVKAIEESRISIIVFSKSYAHCTWCLDALAMIIDCMKTKGKLVFSIFYDVYPIEVRHQSGSFGVAMAEHAEYFKNDMEKVQRWKLALSKATRIPHWRLGKWSEDEDIPRIVEEVSRRLLAEHLTKSVESIGSTMGDQGPRHDVLILSFKEACSDSYIFLSRLDNALCMNGINAFKCVGSSEWDEDLRLTTARAIEESRISIIVFSESFAHCTWCLDVLAMIIDCMKRKGKLVFPIFYGIDSSDVRYQLGSFEIAMAEHSEYFKNDTEKVQRWKLALREAACMSGWSIEKCIQNFSEVIPHIVEAVSWRPRLEHLTKPIEPIVNTLGHGGPRRDVLILSFGDTCSDIFADDVYNALYENNINAFKVVVSIKWNEDSDPTSLGAVEGSRILIIVFSNEFFTYSPSRDDTLVMILDCMKTKSKLVLPIFYGVDLSYARLETSSWKSAMQTRMGNFLGYTNEEKLKLKLALFKAARGPGWRLEKWEKKGDVISCIVEEVSCHLRFEHSVSITSHHQVAADSKRKTRRSPER